MAIIKSLKYQRFKDEETGMEKGYIHRIHRSKKGRRVKDFRAIYVKRRIEELRIKELSE